MLQSLIHILRSGERRTGPVDHLEPLKRQLEALRADMKGHKPEGDEDDIRAALGKFRCELRLRNSREAVYVCLGCLLPTGPKKQKLIEDNTLFPTVLSSVEPYRKHLAVFQDCYKGLLDAYLAYHPASKRGTKGAWPNWTRLRDWLSRGAFDIYDPTFQENWVNAVRAHPELFSDQPLGAFGLDLLAGANEAYDKFARDLGISKASWLEEEMVRAMIRAAAGSKEGIVPHLTQLISALRRVAVENLHLFNHGLAEVFEHYYAQTDGEVHDELRDVALEFWRNPMQDSDNKYAWEQAGWALLENDPLAMAKAWFASHIIEKFFSVLTKKSEREQRDKRDKRIRRMKFWVEYAGALTDVKFALGPYARTDNDPRMRDVLELMRGMTLNLQGGGDSQNNAFILRFGDWVVVEFGLESNATFIYRASDLPFERGDKTISTQVIKSHIQYSTGSKSGPIRKEHRDSGGQTWEDDYRDALKKRGILASRVPVFNSKQKSTLTKSANPRSVQLELLAARTSSMTQVETRRPAQIETTIGITQVETRGQGHPERASQPRQLETRSISQTPDLVFGRQEERELLEFCRRFSVPVRDVRERTGYIWVVHDSEDDTRLTEMLTRYGFKYRPGRGWWWQKKEA